MVEYEKLHERLAAPVSSDRVSVARAHFLERKRVMRDLPGCAGLLGTCSGVYCVDVRRRCFQKEHTCINPEFTMECKLIAHPM